MAYQRPVLGGLHSALVSRLSGLILLCIFTGSLVVLALTVPARSESAGRSKLEIGIETDLRWSVDQTVGNLRLDITETGQGVEGSLVEKRVLDILEGDATWEKQAAGRELSVASTVVGFEGPLRRSCDGNCSSSRKAVTAADRSSLMQSTGRIRVSRRLSGRNSGDGETLLAIKQSIDPHGNLSSWNASNVAHFCDWLGITCDPITGRVTELNLTGVPLGGFIPSFICNLTYLANFTLSYTNLFGTVPAELSRCEALYYLHLDNNQLTGSVPAELGQLQNLHDIYIYNNFLSGIIPEELGNCSMLTALNLVGNNLRGFIPPSLGNCSRLAWFSLDNNSLSGHLPKELGLLTELEGLFLSNNSFEGSIPELGSCTALIYLHLALNKLSGQIPLSLGNCSFLNVLNINSNSLTGSVPEEFGLLSNLEWLLLENNSLSGSIPWSLGNCQNLKLLYLYENNLTGMIPSSLSNCTALQILDLSNNSLTGAIPGELGGLSMLQVLVLKFNFLQGGIPGSLSNTSLVVVDLSHNLLEGRLSSAALQSGVGGSAIFPEIRALSLAHNRLDGDIPSWIWTPTRLQILDLSHNFLTGTMSDNLSLLAGFKNNGSDSSRLGSHGLQIYLKGQTSVSYAYLTSQDISLDLSYNGLEGGLPTELGTLTGLFSLNLAGNRFTGNIPSSLGNLKALESLEISSNQLTGAIPSELATIPYIGFLNLSYNQLSGSIPSLGWFNTRFQAWVFEGNAQLCGKPLANACPSGTVGVNPHPKAGDKSLTDYVSISGFFVGLAISFMSVVCTILVWKPARQLVFPKHPAKYERYGGYAQRK